MLKKETKGEQGEFTSTKGGLFAHNAMHLSGMFQQAVWPLFRVLIRVDASWVPAGMHDGSLQYLRMLDSFIIECNVVCRELSALVLI